jgi:hypothetical protein
MRNTIDMAIDAGLLPCSGIDHNDLKAFEALVRADERNRTWTQEHWTEYEQAIVQAEREACAKVCENEWSNVAERMYGQECAAAIRARLEQPEQEPVALHAMAKRRVFDAIRGAYDLGYNDARNAQAIPGDSAPGYKGRDVEADHGNALMHALERYTIPPAAQPAPVQEENLYDLAMKADNGGQP